MLFDQNYLSDSLVCGQQIGSGDRTLFHADYYRQSSHYLPAVLTLTDQWHRLPNSNLFARYFSDANYSHHTGWVAVERFDAIGHPYSQTFQRRIKLLLKLTDLEQFAFLYGWIDASHVFDLNMRKAPEEVLEHMQELSNRRFIYSVFEDGQKPGRVLNWTLYRIFE